MKKGVRVLFDDCMTRYPLLQGSGDMLVKVFETIVACHRSGGTVLICGNGGSAADSEHIVGELMNKFRLQRPLPGEFARKLRSMGFDNAEYLVSHLLTPVRAISLVSQVALTTAIANDTGADIVFAQQVFGYGRKGDVLIALSTSGNSPNVVNAIKVAKAMEMTTIGFTAESGGIMKSLCDCIFCVPEALTFKAQELHLPLYHVLCAMVEEELFGKN